MYLTLIARLACGVLAVFGLYMLWRWLLLSTQATTLLPLTAENAALRAFVQEACLCGGMCPMALLCTAQKGDTALLNALREANIKIYFIC